MLTFTVLISARDGRLGYPFPGPPAMASCLVGKLPLGVDETIWVTTGVDPLMRDIVASSVRELSRLVFLDGGQYFLDNPIYGRLTVFGYTEDEHNTPYIIDLDPIFAVAARLNDLGDGDDTSEAERASLETFGKELGHRVREAKAS